eukprot:UN04768
MGSQKKYSDQRGEDFIVSNYQRKKKVYYEVMDEYVTVGGHYGYRKKFGEIAVLHEWLIKVANGDVSDIGLVCKAKMSKEAMEQEMSFTQYRDKWIAKISKIKENKKTA